MPQLMECPPVGALTEQLGGATVRQSGSTGDWTAVDAWYRSRRLTIRQEHRAGRAPTGYRIKFPKRCRDPIGNAVFGTSELNTALMLGAGWGINLAVVEYVIRARSRASVRARTPASVTAT
jgi:hypothetical protein